MSNKTNTNSGKIILIASIVLVVVVGVFAYLNLNLASGKKQLTANGEIAVTVDDKDFGKITPQHLQELTVDTFTATQKSSGKDPVDRNFTGVPLADVLNELAVPMNTANQVTFGSVDGYSVVISVEEVLDKENVWLVWEVDGKPLDEKSGPYMVIIRKDPFSQRWSKMLCQVTID